MTKQEKYLKHLVDTRENIHTDEVKTKLEKLGIKLGEHPYKLYGVTYDGNGNEVGIFLDAFYTLEEAEQEVIKDKQFHTRQIDIEEDDLY